MFLIGWNLVFKLILMEIFLRLLFLLFFWFMVMNIYRYFMWMREYFCFKKFNMDRI